MGQGIESMARFLREEYIPWAAERDAVGVERYSLAARVYNRNPPPKPHRGSIT